MHIVVAGHLCLDIIPDWRIGGVDSLKPGSMVLVDGITFSTGGVVSNTGITLKRLGLDPVLIAKIGDDYLGGIVQKRLAEESVATDYLTISPGATTSYTVVLNPPQTDRIFLHYPGTNDTFSASDIDFSRVSGDLFHFGYPPLMKEMYSDGGTNLREIFTQAKQEGMITSLDMAMPDPHSLAGQADWAQIIRGVIPYVDIFLPSINELLYMLEPDQFHKVQEGKEPLHSGIMDDLSSRLLEWGGKIIGIKMGSEGLYLRTGEVKGLSSRIAGTEWNSRQLISPCFSVDVVGTTGAGDSTIAGFLAEFAQGSSPEEVITTANGVGGFCVRALSATEGIPRLETVKKKVHQDWVRLPLTMACPGWERGSDGILVGPEDGE